MNIIKRSGEEKTFDRGKIANAIRKANDTVEAADKLTEARIEKIAEQIEAFAAAHDRALAVEEVQDIVETKIQEAGAHAVAKNYIKYRFIQDLSRHWSISAENSRAYRDQTFLRHLHSLQKECRESVL